MTEAKKAFINDSTFPEHICFSDQSEIKHYVAQTQSHGSEMHIILPSSVPLCYSEAS